MSSIQNTLNNALPVGAQDAYPHDYANVVGALNERDYALTDLIAREVSRRFGVTEAQVKSQLASAGMALRPAPEPEPVVVPAAVDMAAFEDSLTEDAPVKKEKKSKKDKTAKLVRKLVKAAKAHGISI